MSFVLYFLGINVKSNPYLLTNFLVFLTPVVSLSYNNTIFLNFDLINLIFLLFAFLGQDYF